MKPKLTVLNFSGGKQSSCLLWMVLNGDLPRPEHFIVLNADPGMENSETYKYTQMMFEKCRQAGIKAYTVKGPNLYKDIVHMDNDATRIDNPPYWTNKDGKLGKLRYQKCTKYYKIDPMDRALRIELQDRFGISRKSKRLGENVVEKWIGFSYSEVHRIKPAKQKYINFVYPLIDRRMKNSDVLKYFEDNKLPLPARSVCNACFANGLKTFKDMHDNRPGDWEQAVAVDDALRNWDGAICKEKPFVSSKCKPLRDLPSMNFMMKGNPDVKTYLPGLEFLGDDDADEWSCDSGYCHT